MALITAGQDFATLNEMGENLALCTTINTLTVPEYPLQPIQFGTRTYSTDGGVYVYCKPAGIYAIGSCGVLSNDGLWTFTALTTTNAAAVSGQSVGVMSQCASVSTPSSTLWDAVWIQIAGGCPGVRAVASSSANVLLYTFTTAGVITSTSGGGNVVLNGIVLTTAAAGSPDPTVAPAVMHFPQVLLT